MTDSVVRIGEAVPQLAALGMLRLSVTDRCNFRCRYCMPAKGLHHTSPDGPLTLDELAENVRWVVQQTPIARLKITGGEPLVRAGVIPLIAKLAKMDGIREVSMTTNGSLLPRHAAALKQAGLRRLNISLDSVDPARFAELSRGGRVQDVLDGIQAAMAAGFAPIKLNAVLQRSGWQQDVSALLDMARENDLEIRFIELMRTGTGRAWYESEYIPMEDVVAWLRQQAPMEMLPGQPSSPARRTVLHWKGAALKVGWIAPASHPFCENCERLRMDSRGRLRRCLMDAVTLDVPGIRAQGEDAAAAAFQAYMAGKHAPEQMCSDNTMNQVGG